MLLFWGTYDFTPIKLKWEKYDTSFDDEDRGYLLRLSVANVDVQKVTR